jgi:hypothetical protein
MAFSSAPMTRTCRWGSSEEERATWQARLREIFARKSDRFPSAWAESAAALRVRGFPHLQAENAWRYGAPARGIGRKLPDFPAKRDDFGAKNGHFALKPQRLALILLDLRSENLWKSENFDGSTSR